VTHAVAHVAEEFSNWLELEMSRFEVWLNVNFIINHWIIVPKNWKMKSDCNISNKKEHIESRSKANESNCTTCNRRHSNFE
jgi:hypothetical protein